jgi:hypothetical protein
MAANILVNIKIADVEKEFIAFQIKMCIWATGKMIDLMETVSIFILTDRNIKANLLMEKNKAEAFIIMSKAELPMTDNGAKIENTDLEFIHMRITKNMKVTG